MGELVGVVGAALVRDGRVLASRRTEPPHLAGLWEFPGGKVEDGESDVEALVREVREELRVEVEVGDRLGEDLRIGATAVLRVYLCALLDVPWIPVDLPLVEQLRARLRAPAAPEPPRAGPARR